MVAFGFEGVGFPVEGEETRFVVVIVPAEVVFRVLSIHLFGGCK
jgi:hypothetical protein